jgi:2-desacetyl-2-hydroxyethyl bacteriochlorophyllide A dehydrogenase
MTANKAITFPAEGEIAVEEAPMPSPDPDEVLIETDVSLISTGTERALLTGGFQRNTFPVERVGYLNVGEVIDVGSDVEADWLGKRVFAGSPHAAYTTALAEQTEMVPIEVEHPGRAQAWPVPDGVSNAAATFAILAAGAWNGIRRGEVDWGETVAVFGVGLVGQLAVRGCVAAGAERVIAFDVAESRLDLLPDHPAVETANPEHVDIERRVREATGGDLADVVIEATGDADAIPQQFDALKRHGRLVILSGPREVGELDYYEHCYLPGYEIIGAHDTTHPPRETPQNPWTYRRHGDLFFQLVADGRIEAESMVTHRFPHRDVRDAWDLLLGPGTEALGVILEW